MNSKVRKYSNLIQACLMHTILCILIENKDGKKNWGQYLSCVTSGEFYFRLLSQPDSSESVHFIKKSNLVDDWRLMTPSFKVNVESSLDCGFFRPPVLPTELEPNPGSFSSSDMVDCPLLIPSLFLLGAAWNIKYV